MAVQMKPSAVQQYLADYAREIDTAREPIGIVLLNLGGPTTLDDVEPFLYNLFNDPEIITLPSFVQWLNGPVAWLIAKGRAPSSREGYAAIGGGSPQLSTTEAQGKALEEALAARGVAAKSYVAMRYWQPYTSDCLAALKRDGIQRVVVLPLYPQFSISTSGSSLRLLEKEFYEDPALRQTRNTVIPAWYCAQFYAMLRNSAQFCAQFCAILRAIPRRANLRRARCCGRTGTSCSRRRGRAPSCRSPCRSASTRTLRRR